VEPPRPVEIAWGRPSGAARPRSRRTYFSHSGTHFTAPTRIRLSVGYAHASVRSLPTTRVLDALRRSGTSGCRWIRAEARAPSSTANAPQAQVHGSQTPNTPASGVS